MKQSSHMLEVEFYHWSCEYKMAVDFRADQGWDDFA